MRSDRYQPDAPPYALYALLGASLILNVVMVLKLDTGSSELIDAAERSEQVAVVEPAGDAPVASHGGAAAELELAVQSIEGGWEVAHAKVEHSLARTISNTVDHDADALSAVYSRLFMWDLDLRRDVQKGDEIWMVWRSVEGAEPQIAAAWYKSNKLHETLKVYAFHAPGDAFPSYWHPDGSEVALRLQGGPIQNYDQVTSLLKDRPDHRGMDFRAPVGSEVVSPKAGTVTRVNWNHAANGNCVEVRYPDGTLAKFLHLDALSVRAGQYVKAGQPLAASGNTGHSTAAHLHYELSKGGKTLDPVDYHGTLRRELPVSGYAGLAAVVSEMETTMGGPVASR